MAYFVTACAHMHRNLFQRRDTAELMVATIFRYRDAGEFRVHEYVVMPNHIHLLVTPSPNSSIARVMQLIKGGFSHALRESGSTLNAVWQQRFQERRVRDSDEFVSFARNIRENPVRRGLVSVSGDYPYSSAAARMRLDEFPGLKPLTYKRAVDADLKVGSTRKVAEQVDADLKVGSTGRCGDTNQKVGSTVVS
jgi:REP-associated tyrosine transposase